MATVVINVILELLGDGKLETTSDITELLQKTLNASKNACKG